MTGGLIHCVDFGDLAPQLLRLIIVTSLHGLDGGGGGGGGGLGLGLLPLEIIKKCNKGAIIFYREWGGSSVCGGGDQNFSQGQSEGPVFVYRGLRGGPEFFYVCKGQKTNSLKRTRA